MHTLTSTSLSSLRDVRHRAVRCRHATRPLTICAARPRPQREAQCSASRMRGRGLHERCREAYEVSAYVYDGASEAGAAGGGAVPEEKVTVLNLQQ